MAPLGRVPDLRYRAIGDLWIEVKFLACELASIVLCVEFEYNKGVNAEPLTCLGDDSVYIVTQVDVAMYRLELECRHAR